MLKRISEAISRFYEAVTRFHDWLFGYNASSVSEKRARKSSPLPSFPQGKGLKTTLSDRTKPNSLTVSEVGQQIADETPKPVYKKRQYLFTLSERTFYDVFCEAVGDQYHIFAKVRLGDVFFVINLPDQEEIERAYRNQILCKHFDFVLCDKRLLRPLLAIELDDRGHGQLDRTVSDEFKNKLCRDTGLPLWRQKVRQSYSGQEIAETVRRKIVGRALANDVEDDE